MLPPSSEPRLTPLPAGPEEGATRDAVSRPRPRLLRSVFDIVLRLLAVFVAATMCSFLATNQYIPRAMYDAFFGYIEFWKSLGGVSATIAGRVSLALGYSLLPLFIALLLAIFLGTLAGFWAGARPYSRLSAIVRAVSYLGTMTPSFLLALFVMVFFVLWVLPLTGIRFILVSSTVTEFDPRRLLPIVLTLTARPLAHVTTIVAAATQEALALDFARTAYSKGLSARQVMLRHIWPNVLPALVPNIPIALLFMLSSLPIVEFVFNWPGAGRELLYQVVMSARSSPTNAAQVAYLLTSLGITYMLLVMAAEFVRRRVDPMAREDD